VSADAGRELLLREGGDKATSSGRNDHMAMITAANTPHTITNALMICFSSETDIAGSARDQT